MNELNFHNINQELHRMRQSWARAQTIRRRMRFYVVGNVLGTLLGLALIWLATK